MRILKRRKKRRRLGLALGSGGAKGLAHVEFLRVIDQLKIRPSIISGSSMGALIGALYASGISAKEIENIYTHMTFGPLSRLVDLSFNNKGIIKGKSIIKLLKNTLPVHTFEELKIPLLLVATDFWRQEQVVLDKGSLIDAIRASISIPGIFEPIKIEDRILIDGGIINPVPYDIIRDRCDYLIAIDVISKSAKVSQKMPNMFECILGSFSMMHRSIEEHKESHYGPDLHIKIDMGEIGILDFHKLKSILPLIRKEIYKFRDILEQKDF